MLKLQAEYRDVLENFKERLLKELGERIDSIILYGSVARGEATKDSDIDVLIIGKDKNDWKRVSEIAYEIDFENEFKTFITTVFLTREEFEHGIKVGSPFIYNVIKEGVVLYDNGTYKRICEKVLGAGKRIP